MGGGFALGAVKWLSFFRSVALYDKEYDNEDELSDTADNALRQIENMQYAADLIARGISEDRILKYGFAFRGKNCLIKKG